MAQEPFQTAPLVWGNLAQDHADATGYEFFRFCGLGRRLPGHLATPVRVVSTRQGRFHAVLSGNHGFWGVEARLKPETVGGIGLGFIVIEESPRWRA